MNSEALPEFVTELSPGLFRYDCEQGCEDWFAARLGIPTASMFKTVMASGKDGGESKTRSEYMRKLVGERITGTVQEGYRGAAMERGNGMEAELRGLYSLISGNEPQLVGFFKRKMPSGYFIGASPDSLVGKHGALEIKSAAPHILIDILRADKVPPEHMPQVQGSMLVGGFGFVDLAIGYRGMPMFRRTVERDDAYIKKLTDALDAFNEELDKLERWVRNYGKM